MAGDLSTEHARERRAVAFAADFAHRRQCHADDFSLYQDLTGPRFRRRGLFEAEYLRTPYS
jgi:hypothetical protein